MAARSDMATQFQSLAKARDGRVDVLADTCKVAASQTNGQTCIYDIRRSQASISLVHDIERGLKNEHGKHLPTLLLYNEPGLKLFEDITFLDEYYLTNEEIGVLQEHADAIARSVPSEAILCELGSG